MHLLSGLSEVHSVAGPVIYSQFRYPSPNTARITKVAAFDSFVANAGAYELAGSTLTIRPIVARDPNYMVGGFNKYQFRIEGNTMTLTNKSTDLNMRFGEQVVPSNAPASETRITLARLE